MELITQKTLFELAEEINDDFDGARAAISKGIAAVYQAGQKLLEAKSHPDMKHGMWERWCAENVSVGKAMIGKSMKLVRDNQDSKCLLSRHLTVNEALGYAKQVATDGAHVGNNSGDNEWYTPTEYMTAATKVMGSIELDPASSPFANETVDAAAIFTEADDGLEQEWFGNVWLNPPYAQPLIGSFCQKVMDEYKSGNVKSAIVLTNNATETKWFQVLAETASAFCFPAGRVKFWHPDKESAAPLQGQAITYFGTRQQTFVRVFRQFGQVMVR